MIRIVTPGGAGEVIAESLLLEHPLLILNRSRKKAPRLHSLDRILQGLGAMRPAPPRVGSKRPSKELIAAGLQLDQDVVRRMLAPPLSQKSGGGGPSWLCARADARDRCGAPICFAARRPSRRGSGGDGCDGCFRVIWSNSMSNRRQSTASVPAAGSTKPGTVSHFQAPPGFGRRALAHDFVPQRRVRERQLRTSTQ